MCCTESDQEEAAGKAGITQIYCFYLQEPELVIILLLCYFVKFWFLGLDIFFLNVWSKI